MLKSPSLLTPKTPVQGLSSALFCKPDCGKEKRKHCKPSASSAPFLLLTRLYICCRVLASFFNEYPELIKSSFSPNCRCVFRNLNIQWPTQIAVIHLHLFLMKRHLCEKGDSDGTSHFSSLFPIIASPLDKDLRYSIKDSRVRESGSQNVFMIYDL
jgi:hypothetical protein